MSYMHEKEVIELPIWEKYLVYATAFGISEKVIKLKEWSTIVTHNPEGEYGSLQHKLIVLVEYL